MYKIKQFLYLFRARAFRFLPFIFARRFEEQKTRLFGKPFTLVDTASFIAMYIDIFVHQGYALSSSSEEPLIIDCGANIGLSMIYFLRLYPKAKIIAFEPDKKLFDVAKKNTALYSPHISLYPYAVWNTDTTLYFETQGADGGKVNSDEQKGEPVKAISIKKYLAQKVDLLKIDIEGAELTVLEDIADNLEHVDNLFVEYHSFAHQAQGLSKILQIIEKAGFRYYIRSEGYWNKSPFKRIEKVGDMDIQLGIWAYRTSVK